MFKVGKEVVCINDRPIVVGCASPPLQRGQNYTIKDIKYCKGCGVQYVHVGLINTVFNQNECSCGFKSKATNKWYVFSSRFAPLEEKGETMVEEYLIKEPQSQN